MRYETPGGSLTGVAHVSCPADVPVVTGTTFVCTLTVNGQPKTEVITIKSDSGQYEVGVPQ